MRETSEDFSPERLQRYLPFRLYNELILKPGPETSTKCADHQGAQFDPHDVHDAQGKWREATLLFADISGFTAMSERLNARGRAGAEEITHIVNEYFGAMVEMLHRNGGLLLKFGGDALLGMFQGPADLTSRYAVQTALDMQRGMIQFADINTSVGRFELKMKVGLHTGKVFSAHVGTDSQREFWVVGKDVNLTALAEEYASGNQVVVSDFTRQHLKAWSGLEPLPSKDPEHPPFFDLPMSMGYTPLPPRAGRPPFHARFPNSPATWTL